MEKDEKNTVQATEQSTKNPIILPPAQLLDRALETAMSGNGKWLNHKSIHSPQIYGYTGKDVQNTLSGLQQVLLALNTQENQYRTNIYATPKEIKAYNLRLDETAAQKGIKLPSPDGTAKENSNADQIENTTTPTPTFSFQEQTSLRPSISQRWMTSPVTRSFLKKTLQALLSSTRVVSITCMRNQR